MLLAVAQQPRHGRSRQRVLHRFFFFPGASDVGTLIASVARGIQYVRVSAVFFVCDAVHMVYAFCCFLTERIAGSRRLRDSSRLEWWCISYPQDVVSEAALCPRARASFVFLLLRIGVFSL